MSSTDEYIGTVAQDVCTTFIIYKNSSVWTDNSWIVCRWWSRYK